MDTTDPDIIFDGNGFCNHCTKAIKTIKSEYQDENVNKRKVVEIINKVKKSKKNNYDCIIGLSGGVDSSYLALKLVKQFGLNPLAVHIDNGWNSNIAVSNIHKIVSKLNIDLITHVIDWQEFKDLQLSFLRASVVDLEMLSDHAIAVIIDKIAYKYKLKYFLIGSNFQTESILPRTWYYYDKIDSLNIRDIHKKYGNLSKLSTFPFFNFYQYITYNQNYGKYLPVLSYLDYNKDLAKIELKAELNWEDYGDKHHESFITMFYQEYILKEKFNINKKRAHLSSLIAAGHLTRNEALEKINYNNVDINDIEEKINYFCKKLEISRNEFDKIMLSKRQEHFTYKSYNKYKNIIKNFLAPFLKK